MSDPAAEGIIDVPAENSAECEELARFAVQENNKKEDTALEFSGVLMAKMEVATGTTYHITLEALEECEKKIYEAKVLKELQEFKPLGESLSTSSDA
ncbi:hypothetical protein AAC387_Pa03g1193 [Persea americana]